MDETKSISTATDVVTLPSLPRERRASVPSRDDKFILEHLNDPNFDLRARSRASDAESYGAKPHDSKYGASDVDTSSQERSLSRAESRDSTAIGFEEYVPTRAPEPPFSYSFQRVPLSRSQSRRS
jgi:hypothetical protein